MGGRGSGRYRPHRQRLPKTWHPRWLDRIDGRSPVAIAVTGHLQALHEHLGGDVSVVEARLIQRLVHCDFFAQQQEAAALTDQPKFDEAAYLALIDRQLRLSQAIGLRRRAKSAMSLREYLAARAEDAQDARAGARPEDTP